MSNLRTYGDPPLGIAVIHGVERQARETFYGTLKAELRREPDD